MEFITYYDLNNDILEHIHELPQDVDLIVGVPRSGMLVAGILALYLNKPLSDLDSFRNEKIYSCGITKNTDGLSKTIDSVKKVLIVEDTVSSGKSLSQVKEKLSDLNSKFEILYYAVYVNSAKKEMVDYFAKTVDGARTFEWNYLHNQSLSRMCCDIDGVLCVDPTDEQNDDGEKYRDFIRNAPVKLRPTRKVGYLVTSRLEKYREDTEYWLKKNGIEYGELIMMDVQSAKERRSLGNHGEFKANIYSKKKDAELFIESNPWQAETIAKTSGKPAFCTDNQIFYKTESVYNLRSELKIARNKRKLGFVLILKTMMPKPIYSLFQKLYKIVRR